MLCHVLCYACSLRSMTLCVQCDGFCGGTKARAARLLRLLRRQGGGCMSLWLFVSMEVDARGGTCLRLDLRWMPEGGHASASTGTKKGWTNKPNRHLYGIPSNDGKRLHACLSSLKSQFRCLSVYTFAIKLSLCLWLPRYPVSPLSL